MGLLRQLRQLRQNTFGAVWYVILSTAWWPAGWRCTRPYKAALAAQHLQYTSLHLQTSSISWKMFKKYFSKSTTFAKDIFCVTVKTEKFVYIFVDFFFIVVSVLNFCVKLRKLLHFQCLLRRWSVSVLDIWSKLEEWSDPIHVGRREKRLFGANFSERIDGNFIGVYLWVSNSSICLHYD